MDVFFLSCLTKVGTINVYNERVSEKGLTSHQHEIGYIETLNVYKYS